MRRWLLLVLTLVPLNAAARSASAPAADPLWAQSFALRPAWSALAARGASAALDSIACAQLDGLLARGERDSLVLADAMVSAVETRCTSGNARDPRLAGWVARALAIHAASPGPDSLRLARTLEAAGEWHYRRHDLDGAEPLIAHALALRERVLPADDIGIALSARGLATVSILRGTGDRLALAQRAWENAARHFGAFDPRTGAYLSVLAGEQNLSGNRLAAMHALEQVLAINEATLGPDHPELDRARYNVAVIAMLVGDFVRARAMLERNAAFESARPRVDSLKLAQTLGAETECLNELGDHVAALETNVRQRAIQTALLPARDLAHYEAQYQFGRALAGIGRYAEAIAAFDSALAGQYALDSLGTPPILFERAEARRMAGDTTGALADVQGAVRVGAIAGAQGALSTEHALLWARVLDDAGRFREALPLLDAGLLRADSTLGRRSPAYASLLLELARARTGAGDPRAFGAALEGAALHVEHLRAGARGFPERQALLYAHRTGLGLDPLLVLAAAGRLAPGERRQALERLVDARALVLDEVAGRQRIARAAADPRGRSLLDSLAGARATLARWLVRARADAEEDSARAVARADEERLEDRLAALGLAPAPAAAPLSLLDPSDALVSYVEYSAPAGGARRERRLLAFVTRGGRDPDVVPLGAAADVDALVARWRRDATDAGDGAVRRERTDGAALRARAWDPVAPHVTGARRVFVVADGALQLVEFDALPTGDGHYLVENAPLLVRLGAERDLARSASSAGGRLLAVGGPDFDARLAAPAVAAAERGAPVECAAFRDARFGRLPGAKVEADDVAARWRAAGGEAVQLTGAAADEAAFKRLAPGCTALHLATHGFVLGGDCASGDAGERGIGGLAPAGAVAAAAPAAAANPLRLAGLAFAGANRRDEATSADDGVLTAAEISALDLSHVDDVVLSACDSGLGDVAAGEGVLGLQRAFRIAGAGTLVVSLWPVDDHDARAWMAVYYAARVGAGRTAPEAARAATRARLAALRAAKRPTPLRAWAGFVALGR